MPRKSDKSISLHPLYCEVREKELECASAVLGLKETRLLRYPDTRISEVNPGEIRAIVNDAIQEIRPDVVLTFGPGGITRNPDHIAVMDAVTSAVAGLQNEQDISLYYWVIP